MKCSEIKDLPSEYGCRLCGLTKPVKEMIVVHIRREKVYRLRPRCKECHNAVERGNRREYKTKYLQNWRKQNAAVNESYWKDNPVVREKARINAARRFDENHDAILIQGRMNRRGMKISIAEAKELLEQFGRCYPTNFGLTKKGLRECERIRSTMRRRGVKKISNFQIRLMVYEDSLEDISLVIKPADQPVPYRAAAETLKRWQSKRQRERAYDF